jgi:hypothetical protein
MYGCTRRSGRFLDRGQFRLIHFNGSVYPEA